MSKSKNHLEVRDAFKLRFCSTERRGCYEFDICQSRSFHTGPVND
jgi:hypothetical protein